MTTEPKRPRGRPKDPNARRNVSFTLPPDVVEMLEKAAEATGRSRSELVEFALRRHLPQYL